LIGHVVGRFRRRTIYITPAELPAAPGTIPPEGSAAPASPGPSALGDEPEQVPRSTQWG
jgi:hypothetical protein